MPSFKKLKSGRWTAVFDLPSSDGKRQQKRLSGYNSRREAELAYIAFIGENKHMTPTEKGLNFIDAYESYLTYQKSQLKDSSIVDIETCFNKFILDFYKDKIMESIKPIDVLDWQTFLNSKQLTTKYKNKIYGYLRQLFKHAQTYLDITNNPSMKVPKFRMIEKKKEMSIWSPTDFNIFINSVDDSVYHAFFNLLFYSGARPGEVIALKWQDLSKDSIHISETITRKLSKEDRDKGLTYKLTSVKNTSSDRIVVLPDKVITELAKLRKAEQDKASFSDNYFIFGGESPLSDTSISRTKKAACKKANINSIRNHDFRHSHASILISMGFDIVSIAKRLGHSDIRQTLNTYGHMMPNKQQEMVEKLNNL